MKIFHKVITGAIGMAAVAALTSSTAQAQNLLADPGFELQLAAPNPNPNGVPGWANFGGASFLSTPLAHSGNWVLDTPDNGGGYSVPGTYQDFAASPGETFTFSGWVYTPNVLPVNGNDFAIFQLSFFTGTPPNNYAGGAGVGPAVGVNIGEPAGGGGVALPQGVWTYASVTATAGAGTGSLGAYILDINADANADFYFDDMSLTATAVPEPASLALLGMGLTIPFYFLRRRKS
jgi:hypothetical protein